MQRHHHRLGRILNSANDGRQIGQLRLAGRDLAELLDIRARDECSAGANHHNGLHIGIVRRSFDGTLNALRNARAERVDGRIIDRDHRDNAIHIPMPRQRDEFAHS